MGVQSGFKCSGWVNVSNFTRQLRLRSGVSLCAAGWMKFPRPPVPAPTPCSETSASLVIPWHSTPCKNGRKKKKKKERKKKKRYKTSGTCVWFVLFCYTVKPKLMLNHYVPQLTPFFFSFNCVLFPGFSSLTVVCVLLPGFSSFNCCLCVVPWLLLL